MRLFISVDLPDRLADSIATVQKPLDGASGLRVTDPNQAHVTLQFLGDVDRSRVPDIERELAQGVADATVDPFTVRFEGLGVFPSLEYIRVVWLGVSEGTDALTQLQEAIETRMTTLGFEGDEHDFTPHVTLARMDHAGSKELVQRMIRNRDPTVGEMRVSDVRLTESTLTDTGPAYTTVERFPLE